MSFIIQGNDIARGYKEVQVLPPVSRTATAASGEIDISTSMHLVFNVNVGALSGLDVSNLLTFTVTQSKTSGGSFTEIEDWQYDFVGGWDGLIDADAEADAMYRLQVFFKPEYKILKLTATETGDTTALYGASALTTEKITPTESS